MPKITAFSIVFVAVCNGQAPLEGPSAAPKARVVGSVTNLAGEPVQRAAIYLRFGELVYTAESGAQGNFVFEDITPGRYSLWAERTGYLNSQLPALIALDQGQNLTGISIKMIPQGMIAGRVVDEEGEPFPKTRVTLYRSVHGPEGRKQFVPSGDVTTDADAAFVIGNLAAGKYYISAAAPLKPPLALTVHRSSEVAYVTVFYPDASAISDAAPITVTAGGQSRGVEIRMRRVPVFRIAGRVVNAVTGQPASNPYVNLIAKGPLVLPAVAIQAVVHEDTFEFDRVPPGEYLLQATPDGMSGDTILVGRQGITVSRGDLTDVLLQIAPAAEIAGRVTLEGGSAGPLSMIDVTLASAEGIYYYPLPTGHTGDDGSFVVRGLERATFRVVVSKLPPEMYVTSVRFNGRDVNGAPIDVSGEMAGLLEIALSPKAGIVSGSVHDPSGRPLGRAWMVMWNPDEEQPNPRMGLTDDDGHFLYPNLKPGEYSVLALAFTDPSEFRDPYDWIVKFEDRAVKVKIEEGSRQVIDPPVI